MFREAGNKEGRGGSQTYKFSKQLLYMSIQKDSAELLVYIYKEYSKDANFLGVVEKIAKELKWDFDRTLRASKYLSDSKIIETDDTGYVILKLLPDGINTVENNKRFKTTFGINIGIFNISRSEC